MTRALRSALARGALVGHIALATACTTLSTAPSRPTSRPAPAPAPPAAETRPAPAPQPLPPPATQPVPRAEPAPRDAPAARPQNDASGASGVLLEQSRAQRAAGSLPSARASLERALRLDPNNPVLWLALGELELQTGNSTQAATMARKAMTLSGRDARLAARAERLLRAAQ
jgi:tetratricopeptide (TPR) repeat protein